MVLAWNSSCHRLKTVGYLKSIVAFSPASSYTGRHKALAAAVEFSSTSCLSQINILMRFISWPVMTAPTTRLSIQTSFTVQLRSFFMHWLHLPMSLVIIVRSDAKPCRARYSMTAMTSACLCVCPSVRRFVTFRWRNSDWIIHITETLNTGWYQYEVGVWLEFNAAPDTGHFGSWLV